jgi:hypothetical protein
MDTHGNRRDQSTRTPAARNRVRAIRDRAQSSQTARIRPLAATWPDPFITYLDSRATRRLRDWVRVHRPKLYGAVTHGTLNLKDDLGELRNRATHATITRDDATAVYRSARHWLDQLN